MERLTDKNDVGNHFYPKCFEKCDGLGASSKCDNCEIMTSICEKLGKYEDLEEQGLLLRLPCKVGNTAYCIEDKKIWDCIVDKVTISRTNGVCFETKAPKSMPDISAIEYTVNDFGKTVFLTKVDAEQKLKEMESD